MKQLVRSPLVSSVLGGLVVALVFLALGLTGRRKTDTIVEEAPVAAQPGSGGTSTLTPHEIYVRDAPGVLFVRAQVGEQPQTPFELSPQQQQSSTSTGSGFLIDRNGYVLTNYHVIEGADRSSGVTVQFGDGVSRRAAVNGEDPDDDLAVLKVNMDGLRVQPLPLGDSTTVRVGDPTLAIGNPFGLDRTLTSGIISSLQRQIEAPDGFTIVNLIQTDAPINPGNSGGPLLDAAGRVIGINSQIATSQSASGASVGIGFAVPINTAKDSLPSVESGRRPRVAYLGCSGQPTPGGRPGVAVQSVQAGGPAAVAGLRPGDQVESVAGRSVSSMEDVDMVVASHAPGQVVVVQASRAGHLRTLRVALGSRPARRPQ